MVQSQQNVDQEKTAKLEALKKAKEEKAAKLPETSI
jgi:hypothetical protein